MSSGNCVVYVGRLSSRTRERDLDDVFGHYGRIVRLDLKAGYAFIEYHDPRDADDAVRNLDGRDVDGSRISVEPSHRGEGRCFACGREGHWARDCREGPRGGGPIRGRGGPGGPGRCYTCGEVGHFARECRRGDRYHPYSRSSRRGRSYSRSRSPSPRSRSRSYSRSRSRSRDRRRDSRSRSYSRSKSRSNSRDRRSRSRSASRSPVRDNGRAASPRDDRGPSPQREAGDKRSPTPPSN